MRILVTNDDGVEAPGLDVLQKIASELSDDVWVIAPDTDQSGAAHSITINDPLRLRQLNERTYAVKGTPTDCVILGVRHVLKDHPPDLILSGVNRGQNMADDVTYSGTIAGAMEGSLLGIPSIALSLATLQQGIPTFKWETPMVLGADLIDRLLKAGLPKHVILNINFPDNEPGEVKGVKITEQGQRNQNLLEIEDRLDTRGVPYYWIGYRRRQSSPPEGSDLWAVYNGFISVTPLFLDLTHRETYKKLDEDLVEDLQMVLKKAL